MGILEDFDEFTKEEEMAALEDKSGWRAIEYTIHSFSDLKEGWDSYKARPISDDVIAIACTFLSRCRGSGMEEPKQVSPCPDGSVQIDWGEFQVEIQCDLVLEMTMRSRNARMVSACIFAISALSSQGNPGER